MQTTAMQFCTFYVENLYLGVEVEQVQEVIRYQEMTRATLAPAGVSGLINLRGQIVTAVDLRTRLGVGPRDPEQLPMNVVVHDGDGAVSLLVDRIGDVVEAQDELFEAAPSTVPSGVRSMFRGAYKLPGRLLLVLDVAVAVDVADSRAATERRLAR
jgi:purine-binding chemotaxis protein CheW